MFTSTRSYLSRFSGLILFILSVFVIGLLLVATIGSINGDNNNSDMSGTNTEQTTTDTSETNLTYDEPEDIPSREASNSTVNVESSTSTSASYSTSDPQTLATTEVSLDSQDSVSINTTATDNSGRVDASGSATDTAALPNTGPSSIMAGVSTITIIMLGLIYWIRSRQGLGRQLLVNNR